MSEPSIFKQAFAWRTDKGRGTADLMHVLCPLCGCLHLHGVGNIEPVPHCHAPEQHTRPNGTGYSVTLLPGSVPDAIREIAAKADRAWWNVVYHETPRALEKARAFAEQARAIIANLQGASNE